jgi:RHS repeat-associated protein
VDATDNAILLGQLGATAGFGRLSLSGNRFGYAGYASDPAVHADWHVRHRVLMAELGRWSRRDAFGYADGASLYAYVSGGPIASGDPSGLLSQPRYQRQTAAPMAAPASSTPIDCGGASCTYRSYHCSASVSDVRFTPAGCSTVTPDVYNRMRRHACALGNPYAEGPIFPDPSAPTWKDSCETGCACDFNPAVEGCTKVNKSDSASFTLDGNCRVDFRFTRTGEICVAHGQCKRIDCGTTRTPHDGGYLWEWWYWPHLPIYVTGM